MAQMPKRPPVVDPGHVPLVFATGIVALDVGTDYVQVTFGVPQIWNGGGVKALDAVLRVVLTPSAWALLCDAARQNASIEVVKAMLH